MSLVELSVPAHLRDMADRAALTWEVVSWNPAVLRTHVVLYWQGEIVWSNLLRGFDLLGQAMTQLADLDEVYVDAPDELH